MTVQFYMRGKFTGRYYISLPVATQGPPVSFAKVVSLQSTLHAGFTSSLSSTAQEVAWIIQRSEGRRFDPRSLRSACRRIPGQDTEPQIAPKGVAVGVWALLFLMSKMVKIKFHLPGWILTMKLLRYRVVIHFSHEECKTAAKRWSLTGLPPTNAVSCACWSILPRHRRCCQEPFLCFT